ncbi:hypothetical protein QTP88_005790 [Uroleucon formosanum]
MSEAGGSSSNDPRGSLTDAGKCSSEHPSNQSNSSNNSDEDVTGMLFVEITSSASRDDSTPSVSDGGDVAEMIVDNTSRGDLVSNVLSNHSTDDEFGITRKMLDKPSCSKDIEKDRIASPVADSYNEAPIVDSHNEVYPIDSYDEESISDSYDEAPIVDSHNEVYPIESYDEESISDSYDEASNFDSHDEVYIVDSHDEEPIYDYGNALFDDSYDEASIADSYDDWITNEEVCPTVAIVPKATTIATSEVAIHRTNEGNTIRSASMYTNCEFPRRDNSTYTTVYSVQRMTNAVTGIDRTVERNRITMEPISMNFEFQQHP